MMNSKLWSVIHLLLVGLAAQAQQMPPMARTTGKPIICYFGGPNANTFVPPPEVYLRRRDNPSARVEADKSQFIVTYVDFPPEAQKAFQKAVDIWQTLLSSSVPIRVTARWRTDLQSNVLGSAIPGSFYRNFTGSQKINTWYAIALAEKMARRELNGTNEADLVANFSANSSWYYGEGDIKDGQFDLTTVVLHELAHGLGFYASYQIDGENGSYGSAFSGFPQVFDLYVENSVAQRLTDKQLFTSPSSELKIQIIGQNLYFNGPTAVAINEGDRPRLYAPKTFSSGSSISHLDEVTYPTGTINALMTPNVAPKEIDQNPGPAVLGIFAEIGWKGTSVLHDRLKDIEELNQPVTFNATVKSDTTLVGEVKLFYSVNDTITNAKAATMNRVGNSDSYTFTLPGSSTKTTIRYYISVQDTSKRTFTSPGEAPIFYHGVTIGPDNLPPTIRHSAVGSLLTTDEKLDISAEITDSFGIDTVYVEYQVNGVVRTPLAMKKESNTDIYKVTLSFPLGTLKGTDVIKYRIVARDKSKSKNTGASPTTDFYAVNVKAISAVRSSYENNFDSPNAANDFTGTAFSITTPSGFENPAIHSEHPYQDGTGPGDRSDYIFQLLVPIRLSSKTDSAAIRFDEIVLVEPGESGAAFGTEDFYDYVVVEGSKDNGKTWTPFADGYDSRDNQDWLRAWNKGVSGNNSSTIGTTTLFKSRKIEMLKSGFFKGGDQILIRFRLLADQAAHGWGWCVDNLKIQVADAPIITSLPPSVNTAELNIYPNPSNTGQFSIVYERISSTTEVTVHNVLGHEVHTEQLSRQSTQKALDLSQLSPGIYFVSFENANTRIIKRIVITK